MDWTIQSHGARRDDDPGVKYSCCFVLRNSDSLGLILAFSSLQVSHFAYYILVTDVLVSCQHFSYWLACLQNDFALNDDYKGVTIVQFFLSASIAFFTLSSSAGIRR